MPINAREFDRVTRKFGFETKNGRDLHAWLEVDGKKVARTRRSKKSSGDLPMWHSILQQLGLDEYQLRDAISCTLDRDSYITLLRGKGVI